MATTLVGRDISKNTMLRGGGGAGEGETKVIHIKGATEFILFIK